jgi:hypothetical protein
MNGEPSSSANTTPTREVRRLLDFAASSRACRAQLDPRRRRGHRRPAAGELVPLYRDPRSDMPVTQFDMKYVEQAGLVKFDFLGLKTLSVLTARSTSSRRRGIDIDLDALPLGRPPKSTTCWQRGDTVGVFQLESEGMRRTLLRK